MLKKIATDVLGAALIVLAVLLGWLPGPGGLPLLIAGLGLLSLNHEWARRWLKKVEKQGLLLSSKIFRRGRVWQIALDLVGIAIIAIACLLTAKATHNYFYTIALALFCMGLVLLLGNRSRFARLKRRFKPQA
ncbi:MAG TPA: PGPGW domain-containing protein [Candidatus Limnocylindrales bacterium]|nr:PGPGW domain-containing protein [Candidatus Limnocylindrales bacterium]